MKNAIFTALDDNYVKYAIPFLNSIKKNWPNHPEILCHYFDLTDNNISKLKSYDKVTLIQVPKTHYWWELVTKESRLLYFPLTLWSDRYDEYDNILKLDMDILVLKPLDQLIQSSEFLIFKDLDGASILNYSNDIELNKKLTEDNLLQFKHDTFVNNKEIILGNCGVYLIPKKFRSKKTYEYMIYLVDRYCNHIKFYDQSIVNMWLIINNIKVSSDNRFNFISPLITTDQIDIEDVYIIHFAEIKPTDNRFLNWDKVKPYNEKLIQLYSAYNYIPPVNSILYSGVCLDPCGIGIVNRNIISNLLTSNIYNINISDYQYSKKRMEMINDSYLKTMEPLKYNSIPEDSPVIFSYALGLNSFSTNISYLNSINIFPKYKIFYTVTEVNSLPEQCIKEMAGADEIWVPSNFDFVKFKKINNNTHIITQGYDPSKYNKSVIPNKKIKNMCKEFVFLFSGTGLYRKGLKEVIQSYNLTFNHSDNVTLLIMLSETKEEKLFDYVNITDITNGAHIVIIDEYLHEDEIPSIYACADVFCLPSRGEGWSLPANEFAGMGKPSIITNYGGHLEFLDSNGAWLINVDRFDFDNKMYDLYKTEQYNGVKFPILDEKFITIFSNSMKEAFENRDLVKSKGEYIEDKVYRNFTWNNTKKSIENRLSDILKMANIIQNKDMIKNNKLTAFNKFKEISKTKTKKLSYILAISSCEERESEVSKTLSDISTFKFLNTEKDAYKILLYDNCSDNPTYLKKYDMVDNIIIKRSTNKVSNLEILYKIFQYTKIHGTAYDNIIYINDDGHCYSFPISNLNILINIIEKYLLSIFPKLNEIEYMNEIFKKMEIVK